MDFINALDILIGLIVIFLVLAITCTVINEWIDTIIQVRAKKLQDTISEMFGENTKDSAKVSAEKSLSGEPSTEEAAQALTHSFFTSKTVRSLYRKNTNSITELYKKADPPSYISAKVFREVLFTIMPSNTTISPLCKVTNFNDLQNSIDAISNTVVRSKLDDIIKSVLQTVDDSTNLFAEFNKGVEAWYDESMERTSDWYKRKVQFWTFLSASILCIALNVDTVSMAQYFAENPTALEVYINAAQKIARMPTVDSLKTKLGGTAATKPPVAQKDSTSANSDAAKPQNFSPVNSTAEPPLTNPFNATATTKLDAVTLNQQEKSIDDLNERLIQGVTLPLGWGADSRRNVNWLTKILGLLISIAAVSAGAPFWFDTLSRVMNIRNSLKEITDPKSKKS